jgi:predicted nucleic acid-binding protein
VSDKAVTNSTCLIGLQRIGQLEILPQVYPVVFTPQAVQAEVGITLSWLRVQAVQNTAFVTVLQESIHRGEAEAIALAIEVKDVVVILDEKKARAVAKKLGLQVTGTVGMLLRGKKRGVIPEVKPLLISLQEAGFRLSENLIQEALRLAGES